MVKLPPKDKQLMIEAIKAKLFEIDPEEGAFSAKLPRYIVSLIERNKPKRKIISSLEAFLNDQSLPFTEWLLEMENRNTNRRQKSNCCKKQNKSEEEKSSMRMYVDFLERDRIEPKDETVNMNKILESKSEMLTWQKVKERQIYTNVKRLQAVPNKEVNNTNLSKKGAKLLKSKPRRIVYTLKDALDVGTMIRHNPNENEIGSVTEVSENTQISGQRRNVHSRLGIRSKRTLEDDFFVTNQFQNDYHNASKNVHWKEDEINEGGIQENAHYNVFNKRKIVEQNDAQPTINYSIDNQEKLTLNLPLAKRIKLDENSESAQSTTSLKRCSFWPNCKNKESCKFLHPRTQCIMFPNCLYGAQCRYIHPMCKFLNDCHNPRCIYLHTGKVVAKETKANCKFFPNCNNAGCAFYHPKLCRYGQTCLKKASCSFYHPTFIVTD